MNAIVQLLNTTGWIFVDFAVPMLLQSSVLILLAVDAVLRKRVRAVLRYSALLEAPESSPVPFPQAELSPAVTDILSQPQHIFTEPPRLEPTLVPPSPTETA